MFKGSNEMNRFLSTALAVGCVFAMSGTTQAEMPSQATLSAMGLSGIQAMSDSQAMGVRGMGYYAPRYDDKKPSAVAYGHSYAQVSGYGGRASSTDGYRARGKHHARGRNESQARIVITKSGNGGGGDWSQPNNAKQGGGHQGGRPQKQALAVYAGGFSYASTK